MFIASRDLILSLRQERHVVALLTERRMFGNLLL